MRPTNHQREIEFLIEVGEGAFNEILARNELSDLVKKRNLDEAEDGSAGRAFNKQITGRTPGSAVPSCGPIFCFMSPRVQRRLVAQCQRGSVMGQFQVARAPCQDDQG